MSLQNETSKTSLLPYLESGGQGIAISFGAVDNSVNSETKTMPGSGPYTSLRWGRLLVDGATSIADLIFVFQSDIYDTGASELLALNNPDIDARWQDLLRQQADAAQVAGSGMAFAALDDEGVYRPFDPLFLCQKVDAFCHPLCPQCGHMLTVCRDDDLLERSGLPPYSTSLDRFLYCSACRASSKDGFFYTRSTMAQPPDNVRNCESLIQDFSRLLARSDIGDALPCIECPHALDCYGEQTLALKRMTPFQFYPFYMLAQPAPDVHAIDFLKLLSGAASDELLRKVGIEQDRLRLNRFLSLHPRLHTQSGFLFGDQQINFLEVLYLKLCFVYELHAMVTAGRHDLTHGFTLDGMWVKTGDQGQRLPWFWNFSLLAADPFGHPEMHGPVTSASGSAIRVSLAQAWFYTFLVNEHQTMKTVWTAVQNLEPTTMEDDDPDLRLDDSVFSPANILRQAMPLELPNQWQDFWQQTLKLGLRILWSSDTAHSDLVDETLASDISELKASIRQSLLGSGAVSAPASPAVEHDQDDQRIAEILISIAQKWASQADTTQVEDMAEGPAVAPSSQSAGQPNEDGDYEETVILTPDRQAEPVPQTSPEETATLSEAADTLASESLPSEPSSDELDKTVVLPTSNGASGTDDLEATVVLGQEHDTAPVAGSGKPIGVQSTIAATPEDDLEKTVVISSPAGSPSPAPPNDAGTPHAPSVDDTLEKTVVISPGQPPPSGVGIPTSGAAEPMSDSDQSDDEDLPETVIIQPSKKKNGKP